MNNPYGTYKDNAILTAPPEELVLLLYDGAIKFINIAIEASKKKDAHRIKSIHDNLIKAQNILTELRVTLNHDFAIANELKEIYEYLEHRLMVANVEKNAEILVEVNSYLRELRQAWYIVSKESNSIRRGQ